MNSFPRLLAVFLLPALMVASLSGCRGFGGDDDGGNDIGAVSTATGSQLAVRQALAPAASHRGAAAGAPTTSTVSLFLAGSLVSGPHPMGTDGYLFTGLTDGTYEARVTVGTKTFKSTKTLSGATPALVLKVSYFNETGAGEGIEFDTVTDADRDGQADAGEGTAAKELSEGSTDPNAIDAPLDISGTPGTTVDQDGDGVPNMFDGDGVTNASDPDVDGDGKLNDNPDEQDIDGDGTPDTSDSDKDGDWVPNSIDTQPGGDGTTSSPPDPTTNPPVSSTPATSTPRRTSRAGSPTSARCSTCISPTGPPPTTTPLPWPTSSST